MTPFSEIEELQKEAIQSAEEALQSLLMLASNNGPAINEFRNYYLDVGTYVQHVIIMLKLDRLDHYESSHVKALIFYVSRNLGVQEEALVLLLQNELQIGSIENIYRKDYDRVIDFLRDIEGCGRLIEGQAG